MNMSITTKRQILVPPRYEPLGMLPSVFLIGPIRGAPDWQGEATQCLTARHPNVHVFSPRSEMWSQGLPKEEKDALFDAQVDWEHVHISHAIRHGVICAWIPPEIETVEGRSYAQTTRFEMGVLFGLTMISKLIGFVPGSEVRMAVGAHEEFSGRRYMQHTLGRSGVTIKSTFEETLAETTRLLCQMQ